MQPDVTQRMHEVLREVWEPLLAEHMNESLILQEWITPPQHTSALRRKVRRLRDRLSETWTTLRHGADYYRDCDDY